MAGDFGQPAPQAATPAAGFRPVDCRTPAELAASSARLWRLVGVWHDLTDEQQLEILALAGVDMAEGADRRATIQPR